MELVGGREVSPVIIPRKVIGDLRVRQDRRLPCPASCHISDDVSASPHHQHRDVEPFEERHALAMRMDREVEHSQPVPCQAVSSALHDDGLGVVGPNDLSDDGLEDLLEAAVIYPIVQRHVHRAVFPRPFPDVCDVTSLREEVAVVLVEGGCHNSVCVDERLLHSVSMMHIDIDVKDAREELEQLQDGQNDVVDVAEARGLVALRMMKPS
mmetsp:Transcript_44830/g.141163  ORF Transcript_44830/g.141163 Transcript_44830/m.141163 type:complete len:210 (+) Transcript_44830:347-976(+)